MAASPIPLWQQIDEVSRELNMRKSVYPKLIAQGKLSEAQADRQIRALDAALSTLGWLKNHEEKIREFVGAQRGQFK